MQASHARLVYTVPEAAALLGVGRSTAYDLIARGELDAKRLGRRLLVTRSVLAELLGCEPPLPGELHRRLVDDVA
jgi:excisionase family DNA binding protein